MNWLMKRMMVGVLLMAFVAGVILAAQPSKKHEFNARLTITAALKENAKLTDPYDSLDLPNVKIPFDVLSKQVTSNFAWTGKSKKGRSVSWQLAGPGTLESELTSGKLELNLPFNLTVDGKRFPVRVKFTTESISDSLGSVSGKRASLQGPLVQSVDLVAGSEFLADKKDLDPKSKDSGKQAIVLRVQAAGQIRALEGDSLFDRQLQKQ